MIINKYFPSLFYMLLIVLFLICLSNLLNIKIYSVNTGCNQLVLFLSFYVYGK